MKRNKVLVAIFCILLISVLSISLFACKSDDNDSTTTVVNIIVPDGSPAIALAKLFKDKPTYAGYEFNLSIVDGADKISAKLQNGEANIAIAPTNIGATIYNRGGKNIKLLATDIQGSLYMVGKESLSGDTLQEKLESLKGKTVYNIGQGATPDITFRYVLDHYGIAYQNTETESAEYVALRYVSSGKELIPLLKKGTAKFGVLGEPAVTQCNNNAATTTLLSIQDIWNEASGTTGGFPQASLFARSELLTSEHKDMINYLLGLLEENNSWVKDNAQTALEALIAGGSTALTILTPQIVESCNIKLVKAQNAKSAVNAYLSVLYASNPTAIGGSMPDDEFFAQ